jgi:pyrroline-5-carboxylate reductase
MADMSDNLAGAALRGLMLLGCGKMGGALLQGWLDKGFPVDSVTVLDPVPSPWLRKLVEKGLRLNPATLPTASVCVLAVKPQMMGEALPSVAKMAGSGTLFLSIAAGTPIDYFEAAFGADSPIIRAMPNTPASVGRGITALIGNAAVTEEQMRLAEALAGAVGETVRLEREGQMDVVTALSGSGPAYVFHLIEAMAAAGEAEGLPPDLAMKLARATVSGAGELAAQSAESPGQLRVNVTSPGGTTAAALGVLMAEGAGLTELMSRAVKAATDRSRELAG